MKTKVIVMCVVISMILSVGSTAQATVVDIVTVPVGNPGNAADSTAYGAVSYEYNIGKYEVTAGQYRDFLNAVADTDTYGLYNSSMDSDSKGCQITWNSGSGVYDFSGRPSGDESDWANRPVNYVSWGDAARFTNWLHNGQPTGAQGLTTTEDGAYYLNGATTDAALLAVTRESDWTWAITSEDEWYKAAYYSGSGSTYYDYPTSSDSIPSNDLINPDPGNNATFYDSGYTIGGPYYRTEVGEHENSESPYDTFDQGGNVWEWNEAIISGSYRGLRGGAVDLSDNYLRASNRDCYGTPTGGSSSVGFRVSEVPEPATLCLLGLGSLALIRRRKRA